MAGRPRQYAQALAVVRMCAAWFSTPAPRWAAALWARGWACPPRRTAAPGQDWGAGGAEGALRRVARRGRRGQGAEGTHPWPAEDGRERRRRRRPGAGGPRSSGSKAASSTQQQQHCAPLPHPVRPPHLLRHEAPAPAPDHHWDVANHAHQPRPLRPRDLRLAAEGDPGVGVPPGHGAQRCA